MRPLFFAAALALSTFAEAQVLPHWGPADPADRTTAAAITGDPLQILLAESPGIAHADLLSYIYRCKDTLGRYPASPFKASLCKRIGDTYYDLQQVKYAGQWAAWYKKAVALAPGLEKETPISFRLQQSEKIKLRQILLSCVFAVYGLVFLLFFVRIFRNISHFDPGWFLRKSALLLGLYLFISTVVFIADSSLFSGSIAALSKEYPGSSAIAPPGTLIHPVFPFVRPHVPLSIFDPSSRVNGLLIVVLGFLPVFMVVLYRSFKKTYSRPILALSITFLCAALWLHFIIAAGFDELLTPRVMITKSRVIFRGEIEEVLHETPQKALQANPDLLKSGNNDLDEFMEKHYPGGFPEKR